MLYFRGMPNNKIMRVALLISFTAIVALTMALPAGAQNNSPEVIVIEASGPVIPPLLSYIERGIQEADDSNAEALIIVLDTPGGSVTVTEEIVQAIRASDVPVIVYIAPRGAIAASAGTLITLAGHGAAMAPETVVGAASPVGGQGEDLPETLESKVKEVLSAQARALAERRGEEAVALANDAVLEAKAVSASEALDANFIDFIADDVDDLLEAMDGFDVEVNGQTVTLNTANAIERLLEQTLLEQILTVLVDPTIVFALLSLGTTAIVIELGSPGGWGAGAFGVTSIGLAMYGLGILPINWLGVVFIVMSFILFIIDIKAPTHGALTTAGIISLIVGGILLFDQPGIDPFGRISIPVVILISLMIAGLFAFVITHALRAQIRQPTTGVEGMIGLTGTAVEALDPQGMVLVASERWRAVGENDTIVKGSQVEVLGIDGYTLRVRPLVSPTIKSDDTSEK